MILYILRKFPWWLWGLLGLLIAPSSLQPIIWGVGEFNQSKMRLEQPLPPVVKLNQFNPESSVSGEQLVRLASMKPQSMVPEQMQIAEKTWTFGVLTSVDNKRFAVVVTEGDVSEQMQDYLVQIQASGQIEGLYRDSLGFAEGRILQASVERFNVSGDDIILIEPFMGGIGNYYTFKRNIAVAVMAIAALVPVLCLLICFIKLRIRRAKQMAVEAAPVDQTTRPRRVGRRVVKHPGFEDSPIKSSKGWFS